MDPPASPPPPPKSSKAAEAESETVASASASTSAADEPPPPYLAASSSSPTTNPGFCDLAFTERHANRIPGGGLTSEQYFLPCSACSFTCGSEIPTAYKTGWQEWVDPSVNFRWESHTGTAVVAGEKRELLGCWICWEFDGKWCKPMFVEEWYMHMRKHFKLDGYKICKGKVGAMQRRRNCSIVSCPKIHS